MGGGSKLHSHDCIRDLECRCSKERLKLRVDFYIEAVDIEAIIQIPDQVVELLSEAGYFI